MKEPNVKRRVDQLLKAGGAHIYKCSPLGSAYGSRGVPDRIACVRGRFLAIECKTTGRRPTEYQGLVHTKIKEAGGTCMVIDGPEGLKELEEWIVKVLNDAGPE